MSIEGLSHYRRGCLAKIYYTCHSPRGAAQAALDKLYTDSHDEVTGMLNLFVLMYADDTVIMAENEHDMQRNLN